MICLQLLTFIKSDKLLTSLLLFCMGLRLVVKINISLGSRRWPLNGQLWSIKFPLNSMLLFWPECVKKVITACDFGSVSYLSQLFGENFLRESEYLKWYLKISISHTVVGRNNCRPVGFHFYSTGNWIAQI